MGDIGPSRQRYDVLPADSIRLDDIDLWALEPGVRMPETPPEPTGADLLRERAEHSNDESPTA